MDFDDLEPPNQAVASRVSRFAPKSSKLKPKKEPQLVPKQEPSSLPSTKTEPQEPGLTAKQDENCFETMAPTQTKPEPTQTKPEPTQTKPEPNDAVKNDVVLKPEAKEDSTRVDSVDEEMAEAEEDSRQVDDPMEEEDAVVRVIDVYFSPSIDADTQLYILQYPLRPNWRPYDFDEECEEVRLNPKSSEVQIDLSVDLRSSNVDEDQANKLNYKKQTLSTKWKPPPADGCAVGLLMGDKLHLHPVNAVVQLRPSRDHLNAGGSVKKNVGAKSEGSIEDKSVATSKMQNKSDGDECWVPLKYHGCKSDISSRYFQQMVAQESSPINFEMSSYDYIATLCPGVSSNTLAKGPSKRRLLALPVEERLEKMLIEGPPLHRFSAIKHFAPEYSDDELLNFLQQHALLLWGFWVPKSRLLYPRGGVEMMARNYALVMLSKSLKVLSSDLKLKKALGDHVKNFLNQFALEKIDLKDKVSYWKFTETPDESFKKKFPNVVKQQEEIFKILDQELSSVLSNVGKPRESESAVTNSGVNSDLVRSANSNPQVTSPGEVPPRKMTMSSETRHALPIALKKLFQTHKVCSFQLICQELRGLALAKTMLPKGGSKIAVDAAQSLDVPQDELKAVLGEVACDIHGCYVLQSSQDDPFRDVVIDMLRGSGPNGKLKKAEILEAARRKLNRDVPNNEYIKAMTELCVSRGSVWVLKSGDGSKQ